MTVTKTARHGTVTLPKSAEELRGLSCARWVRESTKGQFDRYGPESQRAIQQTEIQRLGMVDTGLVWSAAESGKTVFSSDSMRDMVSAGKERRFRVLVAARADRWQRNLRRTLEVLEDDLHPAGVAVWFCEEGLLSSNPRDWDQLVNEAKAAESWLRKHSRRVQEGLEAKRLTRRDPGGRPPIGFRRDPLSKLMEPDPTAIATPRRAFELSASGLKDRDVADGLGLSLDTVRCVLTSPLYIGRLRDGGPANWPPVVALDLWNRVQVIRAARSTNAGRPASPHRPYALAGRIRCAACGRGLIGDTGYYRHDQACPPFRAATPARPRGWRGRKDGKGYRREAYESVIGRVLDQVRLGAADVARIVSLASSGDVGTDRIALRRIEQERTAAASRVVRDRNYEALRLTMERLDREEADALRSRTEAGVPADAAVRYLRGLARTWGLADGGVGRKMLVNALFEQVEVLGLREVTLRLTPEAIAHGFKDVIPERWDVTVGYGRGERI